MVDLKLIIRKKPDCLSSSGTVRGILMDCGLERRTVQVMVNLYDCGILEKIQQCGGVLRQTEVYNLTVQLENYYGTSRQFITEGISQWAEALGVTVEGTQLPKHKSEMPAEQQVHQYSPMAVGFCGSNHVYENGQRTNKDLANGKTVGWTYDGNGVLTISGYGDIADYHMEEESRPWHRFKDEITELRITKGIKRIGHSAFLNCFGIEKVVLPEGLISIGGTAFIGCRCLIEISFPDSLQEIGLAAFVGCVKLCSVTIPKNCRVFGRIFDIKTSVVYSASPIPADNECKLQQIKSENPFVTQFRASQKQQHKSENPLVAHSRATQTAEPVSQVQQTNKNPVVRGFCGSNKADEKDLGNGKNVSWVYDGNGVLTISGIGEIADYSMGGARPWDDFKNEITTLIINKGIRKVGKNAFSECAQLKKLVLSEGMRMIDWSAFYGCIELTHVIFPTSLTEIKLNAFCGCPNLRKVTLPKACHIFHSFRDTTSVEYSD